MHGASSAEGFSGKRIDAFESEREGIAVEKRSITIWLILMILTAAFLAFPLRPLLNRRTMGMPAAQAAKKGRSGKALKFNPPTIESAPFGIIDAVNLGFNVMVDTQRYAAGYVGNKLKCKNCHFEGGMTRGGSSGGISLVGVTVACSERGEKGHTEDLAFRINTCFKRNLNGRPLPENSKELQGLMAYFRWISKDLPVRSNIPWLGLKSIKSSHKPDTETGRKAFDKNCAICHGGNGEGMHGPPTWGPGSFSDGSDMANPKVLGSFIHSNMPYRNPLLKVEEALDLAGYIASQPRPHFKPGNR